MSIGTYKLLLETPHKSCNWPTPSGIGDAIFIIVKVVAPPAHVEIDRARLYWPSEAEVGKEYDVTIYIKTSGRVTNPGIAFGVAREGTNPGNVELVIDNVEVTITPYTVSTFPIYFEGTYEGEKVLTFTGRVRFTKEGTYAVKIMAGYVE